MANPWDQQNDPYRQQGPTPPAYPYYGAPHYAAPAYPWGADPSAPYGRDPATGEPLSDKSVVAAGLLQLFLGGFGVGRLYIGSYGIGFTQMGLTIFGILTAIVLIGFVLIFAVGIWALVDAIMMFTGAVRDGQGRKLR